MNNQREVKKQDRETEEYKVFMQVAKKLTRLEYKQWQIVPDLNDPLRKFTVEKNIGWATLKLTLQMEDFYHRSVYDDGRYDWRGRIAVSGLFHDRNGPVILNTGMRLKPRMARKLIKAINEVIAPKFYNEIKQFGDSWDSQQQSVIAFHNELAKVNGLKQHKSKNTYYNSPDGKLENCPMSLTLKDKIVEYAGEMSYDDLATMAQAMKWGNYK